MDRQSNACLLYMLHLRLHAIPTRYTFRNKHFRHSYICAYIYRETSRKGCTSPSPSTSNNRKRCLLWSNQDTVDSFCFTHQKKRIPFHWSQIAQEEWNAFPFWSERRKSYIYHWLLCGYVLKNRDEYRIKYKWGIFRIEDDSRRWSPAIYIPQLPDVWL